MNKDVLVIGGSIAGLGAAMDLADAGLKVHLIESSPFFEANRASNLPRHLLHVQQLEALKHPNIAVKTSTKLLQVDKDTNGYRVEMRQHPRYIDLTKCTACGDCIEACPVTLPGSGHKAIYLDGQPGCAAIEKIGKSPCAGTCPAGIHVQGYVALIAQGRYREAIDLIHERMPFPSVCGRVCNHACEANCTRGQVDEAVNIMALKRFVADWEYSHWEEKKASTKASFSASQSTGKKVAIVGAGPAGLTAARDLNRLGHAVTIFDALPVAGGMMRVGIPEHRLPDKLLEWEIRRILDEGIELQLNTRVDDIPGLFEAGYDAVLIATGAHVAKKLPIPNADHPNNWMSLDLLRRARLGESINLSDKRILVLGGGNVALDTARTVLRLGVSEVRMACLEPRGEMPGFEWEIVVAEEEGIQMCPGRTFKEVVVEDDQILGVRCVEVDFHGFKDGFPVMDELPDSEHILPADIVIWAIGQGADLFYLPQDGSIQLGKPAGIQTDSGMMTSMPGVFVAGDVHRGVTFFVVDAIGEGHKSARSIDSYLRGDESLPGPEILKKVAYSKEEIDIKYSLASQQKRVQVPSIPLADRVGNFNEVDLTITEEQAKAEAQRCLICGPCSECQACVEACNAGAIIHDQQETRMFLNVGAVISTVHAENLPVLKGLKAVHQVAPNDPISASAAAGEVLARFGKQPSKYSVPITPVQETLLPRIGVFVCECGDHISSVINTKEVNDRLASLPDVVYTQVLLFSCSREAVESILSAVYSQQLDRVVLAACSCCSMDQACTSCTFQRLRSRHNLGVLPGFNGHFSDLGRVKFEFVNIREQCAWVHADHPEKATAMAVALTTAAVARARGQAVRPGVVEPIERSVLLIGRGEAATVCDELFTMTGISTERTENIPDRVRRTKGMYLATLGDRNRAGQALILVPGDEDEAKNLLASFGEDGLRPRVQAKWGGLGTHRPGVFFCDPTLDADLAGKAVAARVMAWLGPMERQIPYAVKVSSARCRACGTCIEICEYGAPELVGEIPVRAARIDPLICTGCGTCAAHCPSGAITPGAVEGAELETALSSILAVGE
jgi:NADPH-dependent glutamate synthase beta subunit-like oxidoreductase